MPLVGTREMFKVALEQGFAVGAFNVNDMEIVQGIVDAAREEGAPLILQVSAGARKYASQAYLTKLVEAALLTADLPSPSISTTAKTSRSAKTASTAASPPS